MRSHSASSGSRHRLASATVPIRCVALVAFLPMKVGVEPRSVHASVLMRGFLRSRPIAFGVPPQSGEGRRESGWRLGGGERLAKFVQGHLVSIVAIRRRRLLCLSKTRKVMSGWELYFPS